MSRAATSLRLRLFVLILAPLVLVALGLGYWRFTVAQQTAEELFDRALMSAALAISRDVAISGGDALSPSTAALIADATGGEVFYHATGPGGIYVTGFAYPPRVPAPAAGGAYAPVFAEATYRGEPVRVLRITETVTIENLTGDATVTVWQRLAERNAFARSLAARAALLIGGLLAALALVVWFGVRIGLRPLADLQDAIDARSPDDLSPIRRPVPPEVGGIVATLNRLLGEVRGNIAAQAAFISDAAHQLRNPAAAIQSMSEALLAAETRPDHRSQAEALVRAARDATRLTEQLLSFERMRAGGGQEGWRAFDLNALVREVCTDAGAGVLRRGIEFSFTPHGRSLPVRGDRVFVAEAIKNLLDNALAHGGPGLSKIVVTTGTDRGLARATVADDGQGVPAELRARVTERFTQARPSNGAGLGLAIVKEVAERHGGWLKLGGDGAGLTAKVAFPLHRA